MQCKQESTIQNPNGDDYTWRCKEESLKDSDYCILHTAYPEDPESQEYKEINKLKMRKIKEKLKKKDFDYIAAILERIGFRDMDINRIDLRNAKVGSFHLKNVNIIGDIVDFGEGGKIENFNPIISIKGAKITNEIYFENVRVEGSINFSDVKTPEIIFNQVHSGWCLIFENITIENHAQFMDLEVNDEIRFNNAKLLCDNALFDFKKIKGPLYLEKSQFKNPKVQEKLFRIAKNIWEGLGDRTRADEYFYREMEGKRLQKSYYKKYPEILIQYCFGYGVYPFRVILTWISVILIFTWIYSTQTGINGNLGFLSYLYSSVVTAITPGFGTYTPEGIYQLVASVEAIIGTFMWAAFIATFTRKYMR